MKISKRKLKIFFNRIWPYILIFFLVIIFFWKYIFQGLIPIPADFIVGTYYPWLSYDWGIPAGVPVKNPVTSDVVSVIYPLRIYAIELIKNGIKPLWNPLMFAGYPLSANFQVALYSPTIFLYFLINKIDAWSVQVILQPLLSSVFMYSLLRDFRVKKFNAVVAGIIYAFSGFSMIWLEWNAHSLTAACIPLLILLLRRYQRNKRMRELVCLSLSTSFLIFSGYPQLIVYAALAGLVYIMIYKLNFMNLLFLGIFFAFGISLTSFQTLPAMELLRISQRSSEGIDPNLSYLPYKHLVNMFAPDYFGNQATGNFWSDGNYTNTAAYTGIITFVFASIAVIKRINRKKVKYFTAVFFLGLILTLKSPISEFTYMIKLIGSEAASTTRSLVLVNFALAGLFGIGIETLEKIKRKDLFVLIIPWTVLIGALLYSLFNEKPVGYRNLIFPGILLGFVTSLLVSLLKIKNNKYIKLSGVIVAILVVIELFRFGWKYTPFSPKEYIFPETDLTTYLQKDKLNRIHFGEVIPMNMWVSYGLPSLGSYDAVYPSIIAEYIAANNSSTAEATMMGRIATVDNSSGVLFDMAGINRLLSLSSEYDIYDSDYSKLFNDDKVYVYKNNSAIDRIKLYSNWKVIDDENKHLAYILDNNFDLEEEVIIFEDVNLSQSEDVSLAGDILAKEYESQEITIKVNTKRDALLFLSDTFYPGWEAYVDGEKEKIVRANYAFRAVPVRSGSKTVKFVYNPKSFKIGLWISGVTFIFLIAINVYSYKKTLI